MHRALLIAMAGLAWASNATAQDYRAPTTVLPEGFSVRQTSLGPILVNRDGITVYRLNADQARYRSGIAVNYCTGSCADRWTPVHAPDGVSPPENWTVIKGPDGQRQWAFRNDPVFTLVADSAPGSVLGQEEEDMWYVIGYRRPAPSIVAPSGVKADYAGEKIVFMNSAGRALYVRKATDCAATCPGDHPLYAGLAAHDIGAWKVIRSDERPRWAHNGRPVFSSNEAEPTAIPREAEYLIP